MQHGFTQTMLKQRRQHNLSRLLQANYTDKPDQTVPAKPIYKSNMKLAPERKSHRIDKNLQSNPLKLNNGS